MTPAFAATVVSAGFESGCPTQTPTGWTESGQASAGYPEAGGRSGSYRDIAYVAADDRDGAGQQPAAVILPTSLVIRDSA